MALQTNAGLVMSCYVNGQSKALTLLVLVVLFPLGPLRLKIQALVAANFVESFGQMANICTYVHDTIHTTKHRHTLYTHRLTY